MLYRFEGYLLDAERRELRRGAELLAVEPQVFDLLEYLVRNHQRVVSKNDLVAGVWDGRIVAESTLSSRMTAVRKAVGDDGERQRLIRTIPRKGFRFIAEVRRESRQHNNEAASGTVSRKPEGESRPTMDEAALSLPDKPSIAVLPFANISGDPAQRYFVDGVVEDITTALSQFRWLFVIARSSSFTYEGRVVDVKQVGRELGVRYVLEGSIRKAANRVRITAQLIDATTATHLWADRFDGAIEDIFDLQDQLTASVVGAIGPKLERAEIERAKRKPTDSLDAYDHYLRGMDKVYQWTRQSIAEALALFHQAIRVDPGYASAYGMAAYCYVQRKSYGWFVDRPEEVAEAVRLARQAAALGKDDAVALSKAAHAFASLIGDAESGVAFIDQALQLNPNLAAGWYVSGWLRIFFGEPESAIGHLARAVRLSPFDPSIFKVHAGMAYAHFFADHDRDAAAWAEKALRAGPVYLTGIRAAAVSFAVTGRLVEARKLMRDMRELDPALRISNLKDLLPLRRTKDFAKWAKALRMAGLPE